jgi:hypothetical protein
MSRAEVAKLLGPPDDVGGSTRKYRTPCIYKYGRFEVTFEPWRDGGVVWVMDDDHNKVL